MFLSQHELAGKRTIYQLNRLVYQQIHPIIILYILSFEGIFRTGLARFKCSRKKIDKLIQVEVV
jgi:hypothetical protein